jgi:hypothetical protein
MHTVVKPGSDWFSGTPTGDQRKAEADRAIRKEVDEAKEREKARREVRAASKVKPSGEAPEPSRAQKKLDRLRAEEHAARAKLEKELRKIRAAAERRSKNAKHIAHTEDRLSREEEMMKKVQVLIKPKSKLSKHRGSKG